MRSKDAKNTPNLSTDFTAPIVYDREEERWNVLSHAVGIVGSLIGTAMLLLRAWSRESDLPLYVSIVFGGSMLLLYTASTLYHANRRPIWRWRLRILDHAAIYLLIAGTYTPFTLLVLPEPVGDWLFAAVWLFAVVGVILKLFFTGRFDLLSTILYLAMGWLVIFAMGPLIENLPWAGLRWVVAGGFAYTLGAGLYLWNRLPYNHALFHLLVLIGSTCHFLAVYYYVV